MVAAARKNDDIPSSKTKSVSDMMSLNLPTDCIGVMPFLSVYTLVVYWEGGLWASFIIRVSEEESVGGEVRESAGALTLAW